MSAASHIYSLQESLLEEGVDQAHLENCAGWFKPEHYAAVVEERSNDNRCGWPLCNGSLKRVSGLANLLLKQQEAEADLQWVKVYCSRKCLQSSTSFASGISTTPLALRRQPDVQELLRLAEKPQKKQKQERRAAALANLGVKSRKPKRSSARFPPLVPVKPAPGQENEKTPSGAEHSCTSRPGLSEERDQADELAEGLDALHLHPSNPKRVPRDPGARAVTDVFERVEMIGEGALEVDLKFSVRSKKDEQEAADLDHDRAIWRAAYGGEDLPQDLRQGGVVGWEQQALVGSQARAEMAASFGPFIRLWQALSDWCTPCSQEMVLRVRQGLPVTTANAGGKISSNTQEINTPAQRLTTVGSMLSRHLPEALDTLSNSIAAPHDVSGVLEGLIKTFDMALSTPALSTGQWKALPVVLLTVLYGQQQDQWSSLSPCARRFLGDNGLESAEFAQLCQIFIC
ncbi:unnamed protein product [Chrysoparadoxa australica]